MWFPETSRTLAIMGAEVILHPSLTGTIDRDIELSINRRKKLIKECEKNKLNVSDIEKIDLHGMHKIYDKWPKIARENYRSNHKLIHFSNITHRNFKLSEHILDVSALRYFRVNLR